MSIVMGDQNRAFQSAALCQRFPVRSHPFVRQKPVRRLLLGALRARKPALPSFPSTAAQSAILESDGTVPSSHRADASKTSRHSR